VLPVTDPSTGEVTHIWHSTSVRKCSADNHERPNQLNLAGGPRIAWSGHVFTPLQFNPDGTAKELDCSPAASFQVFHTAGTGPNPKGRALDATDGSPLIANVSLRWNVQLGTLL
jgi:hypothetical protein